MDLSKSATTSPENKTLRQTGFVGLGAGVLALLACELPIIFAVMGFGGLGASAIAFRPPPAIEVMAIISALIGTGALVIVFIRHHRRKPGQD